MSELERMVELRPMAEILGEFIEWLLSHHKYALCERAENKVGYWLPKFFTIENLLADYFELDMEQIEKERREILTKLQKSQLLIKPKRKTNSSPGGYARAASLTPERRSEIARHAAKMRWAK